MKDEGAALGTGLKEFASRGVPWIIEAAGSRIAAARRERVRFLDPDISPA